VGTGALATPQLGDQGLGDDAGGTLGRGTCYIEFGSGRIGSVDIDFLSGPERTGTFNAPSAAKMAEKDAFGSTRSARWFGR
jgi:sulfide:quinone oxidoreductase